MNKMNITLLSGRDQDGVRYPPTIRALALAATAEITQFLGHHRRSSILNSKCQIPATSIAYFRTKEDSSFLVGVGYPWVMISFFTPKQYLKKISQTQIVTCWNIHTLFIYATCFLMISEARKGVGVVVSYHIQTLDWNNLTNDYCFSIVIPLVSLLE